MNMEYIIVELNGQMERMFQSKNLRKIAIEINKLKIEQPNYIVKKISEIQYKDLLLKVQNRFLE
jgi:hypothetical protein